MKNRSITDFDLDILGELGNIGSGNAATALSQMLNRPVLIEVPTVKKCNLTGIPQQLGNIEEIQTAVFLSIRDSLDGYIMLLLKDEDVRCIADIVASGYPVEPESVIMEVANIITGAYVNALSSMINGKLNMSPPEIGHDMLGSLVDSVISMLFSVAEETVIITNKLIISDKTISCNYILLLEQESLNKLLEHFNQEEKI